MRFEALALKGRNGVERFEVGEFARRGLQRGAGHAKLHQTLHGPRKALVGRDFIRHEGGARHRGAGLE